MVPNGVAIGVPPAYAFPPSVLWQPRQLPRCASSAPLATSSRGNEGAACSGSRRSCDAQPAKPVTTPAAMRSAAAPSADSPLVASRRFSGGRGRRNRYAVFVDHFATKPAGDDQQHERNERQPDEAARI